MVMCEKCRAGQMEEYQRVIKTGQGNGATISGSKCNRCGYIQLDSDDDIWSAVGL